MSLRFLFFLSTLLVGVTLIAQEPLTTAERSGFTATSTCADVAAFLKALEKKPMAKRLLRTSAGKSGEGKTIELILASEDPRAILQRGLSPKPSKSASSVARTDGKVLVLVMANIHGGEVEGKEVVQILLREIADGRHGDILSKIDLAFIPVYNTDGNDKIDPKNRVSQNGPSEGVGLRVNTEGLDLNRDFIKVESPECRALMRVFRNYDPEVFMDLHTTNGSRHGYHLTYAFSTCTNVYGPLTKFMREVYLPEVKRECADNHLLRTFDYGNYAIQRLDRGWYSFDHRARYATNYYALRNRLCILSEAYSYQPFEMRVIATRAFVLENLRSVVRHLDRIKKLCADGDRGADQSQETAAATTYFPYDTHLAEGPTVEVLGAELEVEEIEGLGKRYAVLPGFKRLEMPLRVVYESRKKIDHPRYWVIPGASPEVREKLLVHGVAISELVKETEYEVQTFRPTKLTRAKRIFQKHYEVKLEGQWVARKKILPAGTLVVSSRQPLRRLAAQLLSPHSEDGLVTWNYFDDRITVEPKDGEEGFPVYRLNDIAGSPLTLRAVKPL